MRLRVLNLASAKPQRSPDILVEIPFRPDSKVRVCVRTVQQLAGHEIRSLAVQVCRVSDDGRWVNEARAVPFADFRRLVVDQWVFGRIRKGGLLPYFQPIVALPDGRDNPTLYGHEALIRCQMDHGLTLNAGELFALAYHWRLRRYLNTAALWSCLRGSARCSPHQKLFVNVDPCLTDTTGNFWDRVDNLLVENGFPNRQLTFEIVESERLRDRQVINRFATEARQRGFRIALDDFGAQNDPFQLLFDLRPDYVKLEATLVRGSLQDPWKRTAVENLVRMTSDLSVPCVVEGIEDDAEWQWANRMQAPLMQGYRFGRPAPEPMKRLDTNRQKVEAPFFGTSRSPAGMALPGQPAPGLLSLPMFEPAAGI